MPAYNRSSFILTSLNQAVAAIQLPYMDDRKTVHSAFDAGLSIVMTLLHRVPDVVWAAIIAAGIAFITTILSNRNSRKQLKMQLDHTATHRDRDRAMSLRRDVYLPAIRAVIHCHGLLGRATDINADLPKLDNELTDDFAGMAKIHLVGSLATIRHLSAFQKAFVPAYFELCALRIPIVSRKALIDGEQSLISKAISELDRFGQMMRQLNIEGSADRAAFDRLNTQCDIERTNFQTHNATLAALQHEQVDAQLALAARFADLGAHVAQFMPEALICARMEIELPIDADEYRRVIAEQDAVTRAALHSLVSRVRETVPKPTRP